MYNRYIPANTTYVQISEGHRHSNTADRKHPSKNAQSPPKPPLTKGASPLEGITGWLGGLLKQFHLEELDSGDILLLLILLFLFLESDDNLELVITLGLLLLFGLFGKDEKAED